MADVNATYERRGKAAGAEAERLPCVVCGLPMIFEPLVWMYGPQGSDDPALVRYAHVTHAGRVSPRTVTPNPAALEAHQGQGGERGGGTMGHELTTPRRVNP